MAKIKCNPILFRSTKDGWVVWKCSLCGFMDTDKHGHFPNKIHRICDRQVAPPLTWLGRVLARLEPGDGLAFLIAACGAKAVAEWASVIEKDCPSCQNRQRWLNDRWREFVWRRFAIPADSVQKPDTSQSPA